MLLKALLIASSLAATTGDGPPRTLPSGIVEVSVEEIHCAGCAKKIARKLYGVKGVQKVASDLKKAVVTVTMTKGATIAPAPLWRAVETGGAKPVELRYADRTIDAEQVAALEAPAAVTTR
ncbi:MAG: heavy-metal-associated domain-containing protein [Lacipirellulaceae bacterium]